MRKSWDFRKRFLSLVLCAGLVSGLVGSVTVQADGGTGFALTKEELSKAGVPVVPGVLTDDSTFMNQYVRKGSALNINSSFELYRSENVSGASGTLPTGTFSRNKNDDWYAQYKWEPTNQLVFTFTVPKEAKHVYIKGITARQEVPSDAVSLLDECSL